MRRIPQVSQYWTICKPLNTWVPSSLLFWGEVQSAAKHGRILAYHVCEKAQSIGVESSWSGFRDPLGCSKTTGLQISACSRLGPSQQFVQYFGCRRSHRTKSFENDDFKSVDEASPCHEYVIKRKKMRLDEICREQYPEFSRNVIQSFIAQGKVLVDGVPVLKAGAQIKPTASITVTGNLPKFVCRAGLKLEAAIKAFGIVPDSRVVLDAGLSTGGFTDCWIQYGASHVFGIDVGYGQVAEKIRVHQSVTVMERTNLRHLRRSNLESHLQGKRIDLVSLDVSFISTLKMRDAICDIMEPRGDVVLLIKPQFEAGKQAVGAGGVVRDKSVHANVLHNVIHGWQDVGFRCSGLIQSPIKGATAGNVEYLCHLKRGLENVAPDNNIDELLLELGLQQSTVQ
eukprot:jgi/Picsp_1/5547/NSC_02906-R1_hemolysin a